MKFCWDNMMLILMDLCNVMRGLKIGLEICICREKVLYFFDVDGDVCYYVYNVVKVFCKLFNNFIE